ncbi:MAG: HlyD family efflux transporter periplasmic adaptor subunit [Devosia sp.]
MNGFLSWLTGLLAAFIPGLGAPQPPQFSGYVDADYVYVAPMTAGVIASFPAKEGMGVQKGDVLFTQTTTQDQALVDAATADAAAARATWQNQTTGGRTEELAVAQAAVNKAQADLDLAQQTFTRSQKLFASNTITQAQRDQDSATMQSAQAALSQAQAQLGVTSLPARDEQQKAAEANAAKAKADLADRTVTALVAGRIERTYYNPGEIAPAGTPVLSLLPAEALKAEFYVDEADRTKLRLGETVSISCDGCAGGMTGTISFLASDPQYTSPLIYSRDERSQMVFLAEARLEDATGVLPGQPVTVSPAK